MDWIKINDAAKLTNKPARTVRHYALLGKLRAIKRGRDWYVDRNSLKEQGWIPLEDTDTLLSPIKNNENKQAVNNSIASNSKENKSDEALAKKGRQQDVRSLGVYRELLEYCQTESFKKSVDDKMMDQIENTLAYLAIGFFEFDFSNKVNSYSSARQHLVRLQTLLHLKAVKWTNDVDAKKEDADLETTLKKISEVLPGLGGLIRKTEKKANEKYARSKNHSQGRKSYD